MSEEAEYFREREQTERAAASQSNDPAIRRIHLEMAAAYSHLAELRMEKLSIRAGQSFGTELRD